MHASRSQANACTELWRKSAPSRRVPAARPRRFDDVERLIEKARDEVKVRLVDRCVAACLNRSRLASTLHALETRPPPRHHPPASPRARSVAFVATRAVRAASVSGRACAAFAPSTAFVALAGA